MGYKIWQKERPGDESMADRVHGFTAGHDRDFDILLADADVRGSLAHAEMLFKTGLISREDWEGLERCLKHIAAEIKEGRFVIEEGVEDVHSQVELELTRMLGDTGKKIHTGRSRNDQVLLDIRLFLKDRMMAVAEAARELFVVFQLRSEDLKDELMPGYTHYQLAMPASFGMWLGAYAESLADDMESLLAAWRINDRNPLGTGAGFGSSFPLDRAFTTEKLGFSDLVYNSMYAQLSRGRVERAVAVAFASFGSTLGRFSADVCLFMNQHFGFLRFPDELTTGSSIMPHKKNPDVFELIRARSNRLQALPNELTLLTVNLPSGYHRDLQLTKEILFPAVEEVLDCLKMSAFMLRHMQVRSGILDEPMYDNLFTVEEVNRLVLTGTPFRDAYRLVGKSVEEGDFRPDRSMEHTHEGSIGNLCNDKIAKRFNRLYEGLIS